MPPTPPTTPNIALCQLTLTAFRRILKNHTSHIAATIAKA